MGTYIIETGGASRELRKTIIDDFLNRNVGSRSFPTLKFVPIDGAEQEISRHTRGARFGPWILSNKKEFTRKIHALLATPGTVIIEQTLPRQRPLYR